MSTIQFFPPGVFLEKENARLPRWLRIAAGPSLVVLCMTPSTLVLAELPGEWLHPYVQTEIEYDSNLFGLPDKAAGRALGVPELGDISRTVRGGLALSRTLSRQEISADLSVDRLRHARFQDLDTDGHNLRANWKWHFSRFLDGDIGASNVRALEPFITNNLPAKNILDEKASNISVNLNLHPSLHLSLSLKNYNLAPEGENANIDRRHEHSVETGIHYTPSSGNTAALQLESTNGIEGGSTSASIATQENGFEQKALKLKLEWNLTAKTQVQFIGGPVKRTYDSASARNYRGTDARVVLDYKFSEKSGIEMALWHELGAPDRFTTVSSLNDGISLTPRWRITQKTRLDGEIRYERRNFQQAGEAGGGFEIPDNYRLRIAGLNLVYEPRERFELRSRVSILSKLGDVPSDRFLRRNILFSAQYKY